MSVTKGKWYSTKPLPAVIIKGEDSSIIATVNDSLNDISLSEANANLIVTAVNQCKSINPENPQAVAESIKDMYDALKELIAGIESHTEGIGYGREMKIREALAKADEKL